MVTTSGPGFQSLPMPPILHPSHATLPFLRHMVSISSPQVISQHDFSILMAAELLKALDAAVPTTTTEQVKHIRVIQNLTAFLAGRQAPGSRQLQGWLHQVGGWRMPHLQGLLLHKQYHGTQCHQKHAACSPAPKLTSITLSTSSRMMMWQ